MKFTKLKAAGIAAGVAVFAMMSGPAQAGSQTVADGAGTDYDPACVVSTNTTPPAPNSRGACPGVSNYDGSRGAEDFSSVKLESTATGELKATVVVNTGSIPAAGSTAVPTGTTATLDTDNNTFQGAGYKVMFQNPDKEHNGDNTGSGCARTGTGRVRDQHGHYKDGYHYFLGVDIAFDGAQWFYSAQVGEYDPSPDGAFFFQELGTATSTTAGVPNWTATDPTNRPKGAGAAGTWNATIAANTPVAGQTTITIEADGRLNSTDTLCATTVYVQDFASSTAGPYSPNGIGDGCPATYSSDCIINVKGHSTADQVINSPVTVPLSIICAVPVVGPLLCTPDLKSIVGLIYGADETAGNSTAGAANSNITGISFTGGGVGGSDTQGDGPTCPTPTVGGSAPNNPAWVANQNQACQVDDDGTVAGRGSVWPEFWDNGTPFTF